MRKLCIAVIALVSMFQINAQEETIEIGAKAGLNFSSLTGDLDETKARTSLHLGVMVEIPMTEKLSIQPELLFSSQGAKTDDTSLIFSYLNIPVLAKYYVTEELSIEAGPQFGYLLSAKFELETLNDTNPNPNTSGESASTKAAEKVDIKDDVKSIDFGLNIGLGYKMDNGINFGARYALGLANVNGVENSAQNFKNGVFQLSVGYFFF
ncbi:PorT family protein [Rasiella rasia]|uniref:PorT family protein n=1 Tax=Rasiella rasia TaxID=2744027 RepID=A0A6G6GNM8_9FLAO|nr:porin family protein [Rasiella rasia]QIE60100.1 PorT family protein [Rasiella rasia]